MRQGERAVIQDLWMDVRDHSPDQHIQSRNVINEFRQFLGFYFRYIFQKYENPHVSHRALGASGLCVVSPPADVHAPVRVRAGLELAAGVLVPAACLGTA